MAKIYGPLEKAQLESLAAPPANAPVGFVYFDTTAGAAKIKTASGWSDLGNPGTALLTSGGTMTGALTLSGDPTSALQASTKSYADGKVTQTITDGVTATAPSENAVFDALAQKLSLSGGVVTGQITANSGLIGTTYIVAGSTTNVTYASNTIGGEGFRANDEGSFVVSRSAGTLAFFNRKTDDGVLVGFYQAGIQEGNIAVSGTTVTYASFSGSHWSQLEDGSRPEILRGTVMESVDSMCEWPNEEPTERLPKCKVSETVASKRVYGVFLDWEHDWNASNDMYVTAIGSFICRIAPGQNPQRGDLLESNGDGCARVQQDDVVRSSTIGKVTSSTVIQTYSDGSFTVPVVLYCG